MPAMLAERLSSSFRGLRSKQAHSDAGQQRRQKQGPTLAGKLGRLFSSCVLIGICYAALYLSIGEPFYYGGPAWSTMCIWAAAQGAGWVFGMLRLPSLLGMLMVGLVLKNAAPSSVDGLPASWSAVLRTAALGTIFLRSGLELDLRVFKRVGGAAVRLLLIPGLTEAFVAGSLAMPLLGLPLMWGYTLGFILKAVGPAIIITTMYELQKQKLGTAKGIPSIITAAASFDDMVAITGYSLFSNFAFAKGDGNLAWNIALGPVEIVLGFVGGILGGLFCSVTIMWRSRYQRTIVAFMTAMTMVFLFNHYNMKSAGPLAALITGMVMRVCGDRGWPRRLSLGANTDYAHQVEVDLGRVWRWAAQPLLFGIIGTLVNLRTLSHPGILPRSFALIVLGLLVRIPMSFMAVAGAGLTLHERVFVAIAWTAKATVQAALGPLPLDTVKSQPNPDPDQLMYAETILTTSVLAILFCGSLGVIMVHLTAPKLLAKGSEPSHGTPERKEWLARLLLEQHQSQLEAGLGSGPSGTGGLAAVSANHHHAHSRQAQHHAGGGASPDVSHRGLRAGHGHGPQPLPSESGAFTMSFSDTDSDDEDMSGRRARRSANLESFSSWRAAVSGALTTAGSTLHQLLHPTGGAGPSTSRRPSDGATLTAGMNSSPSAPALMQSVPPGLRPVGAASGRPRSRMGAANHGDTFDHFPEVAEEEPCTPHFCKELVLAAKKRVETSPEDSDSEPPSRTSSSTPRASPAGPAAPPVQQQQQQQQGGARARLSWADQQGQAQQLLPREQRQSDIPSPSHGAPGPGAPPPQPAGAAANPVSMVNPVHGLAQLSASFPAARGRSSARRIRASIEEDADSEADDMPLSPAAARACRLITPQSPFQHPDIQAGPQLPSSSASAGSSSGSAASGAEQADRQ